MWPWPTHWQFLQVKLKPLEGRFVWTVHKIFVWKDEGLFRYSSPLPTRVGWGNNEWIHSISNRKFPHWCTYKPTGRIAYSFGIHLLNISKPGDKRVAITFANIICWLDVQKVSLLSRHCRCWQLQLAVVVAINDDADMLAADPCMFSDSLLRFNLRPVIDVIRTTDCCYPFPVQCLLVWQHTMHPSLLLLLLFSRLTPSAIRSTLNRCCTDLCSSQVGRVEPSEAGSGGRVPMSPSFSLPCGRYWWSTNSQLIGILSNQLEVCCYDNHSCRPHAVHCTRGTGSIVTFVSNCRCVVHALHGLLQSGDDQRVTCCAQYTPPLCVWLLHRSTSLHVQIPERVVHRSLCADCC